MRKTKALNASQAMRTANNLVDDFVNLRSQITSAVQLWYISGPMTGYANYNYENFERIAQQLREQGRYVVSPHEHDVSVGVDFTNGISDAKRIELLSWDLATLLTCYGAYFLEGWEKSKGATVEHAVARAIGLQCEYEVPKNSRFRYGHYEALTRRVSTR